VHQVRRLRLYSPVSAWLLLTLAAVATADAGEGAEPDNDSADLAEVADGGAMEADFEPGDLASNGDGGIHYTLDLSDAELRKRWLDSPSSLGSVAFGVVEEGRLLNSVRFPEGDGWTVVSEQAFATQETIDQLTGAFKAWHERYPNAPPIRVNAISGPEGGFIRPHTTHQNGRDADVGFVYPTSEQPRTREREKVMDVEKNWALAKELVTRCDVQFILLDRRVQAVLYDYALKHGENREWLDSLFHAGLASVFQHARRHRDHFHVRLFNARAQELGRRLTPLLALRADQNLTFHRVQHGDTLGRIAQNYGSSVRALRSANHLKNDLLSVGRVLQVPLRKPCTRCPVPPDVIVPPRRLPPGWADVAEVQPKAAPSAEPLLEAPEWDVSWNRSPGAF
jgi:hypothetical protein